MRYYLASLVGSGVTGDPFRPLGSDDCESWQQIDLRADCKRGDGWCLFATDTRLRPRAGVVPVADGPGDVSQATARLLGSRLGLTLQPRPFGSQVFFTLMQGDASRWKPLRKDFDGLYRIHLGGVLWEANAQASISDDFNRASLGAGWTAVHAGWGISSNRIARTSTGTSEAAVRNTTALDSDDHFARVDFASQGSSTNAYLGPAVRFAAAAHTYYSGWVRAGGSIRAIEKRVAAVVTTLASDTSGGGPTRMLSLHANGSSLRLLDRGRQALSVTDTTITGNTQVGVIAHAAAGAPQGDNFVAADLADTHKILFDLAPENQRFGTGDVGIGLFMDVDGDGRDLGAVRSGPEVGNDGVDDWYAMEVHSVHFDAGAASAYLVWQHDDNTADSNNAYLRDMRVTTYDGATTWLDQYEGNVPSDVGGGIGYVAYDGLGALPRQADPDNMAAIATSADLLVDPYGDGRVHHIFLEPPSPWVVGIGVGATTGWFIA